MSYWFLSSQMPMIFFVFSGSVTYQSVVFISNATGQLYDSRVEDESTIIAYLIVVLGRNVITLQNGNFLNINTANNQLLVRSSDLFKLYLTNQFSQIDYNDLDVLERIINNVWAEFYQREYSTILLIAII
jgi:hypothetical protein